MLIVYSELNENPGGICFTPHYYKEYMVSSMNRTKTLAVNEIMPDKNSIKNKTYPFVANVYVSIRSDLDPNSMTYKLYEWLQTKSGKDAIYEIGYVPYGDYEVGTITNRMENEIRISPNPVQEGFYIKGINQSAQISLFDYSGRKVFSKAIKNNDYVDINQLQRGLYIVDIQTAEGNKQCKVLKE